jgi:hypothetical protein
VTAEIFPIKGIKNTSLLEKSAVRTANGLPVLELGNLEVFELQLIEGILEKLMIVRKILYSLFRVNQAQGEGI